MADACPPAVLPQDQNPQLSSQSYSKSPSQVTSNGWGWQRPQHPCLRAGQPAGAGAAGQGQEESLVWDTDLINPDWATFPWPRQREIPQLAPGLWKSPLGEVSSGQLSAIAHEKARAAVGAAGWAGLGKPQLVCSAWGWEQNAGNSEKGREQQEVTCGSGTEHGRPSLTYCS